MDKDKKTAFKTFGDQDTIGTCGPDGCNIAGHNKRTLQDKKTEEKKNG